jgi:hypothetical protein
MSVTPGTRFEIYEVVESLGSGGMGELYRAHDSGCGATSPSRSCPPAIGSTPTARRDSNGPLW